MHHVFFTNTAKKHSTAIYEQNLSKLTCFTEAAEAIAMLSRFSRLLLIVVSLGRFIQTPRFKFQNARFRDPLYFFELEIPRLQFETPRFRDPPKICRDPLFFKDHSIPL